MDAMRAIDQETYNYIHAIRRKHRSNSFVEGRRYDMLTQNIAEYLNNLLRHIIELPITKQVDAICVKLIDFSQLRMIISQQLKTCLTPYNKKKEKKRNTKRINKRIPTLEMEPIISSKGANRK